MTFAWFSEDVLGRGVEVLVGPVLDIEEHIRSRRVVRIATPHDFEGGVTIFLPVQPRVAPNNLEALRRERFGKPLGRLLDSRLVRVPAASRTAAGNQAGHH
jgi:hypothetical protein